MVTKKELQEKLDVLNDSYNAKRNEIIKLEREFEVLTNEKNRFEDRAKTLEHQQEKTDEFIRHINSIISGQAKPESKIEVLKDLLNLNPPREIYPGGLNDIRY